MGAMGHVHRGNDRTLLEDYCSRFGILLERRYSGLALLEAKQQAESAAIAANEATLKAKAADRAKSIFLANMAHELRTPLNAIIGFSELIKIDNIKAKECYREYAGYIHDSGILLLDIINGILDLARIEAGRVELAEQLIAVDELVQSAVTTIRPLFQNKSIDVDCKFWKPSVIICVDRTKFQQVILNLLTNGVKFTEPRGRIQVESVLDSRGDLVISIRDTGIGIPPEQVENVLEPFEQVADHLTRENQGTGLGLPISRALMELHGGELVLSSELGVGTTARLRLPRDRIHGVARSAAA
jgi:signal transduction histidine kinase